MTPPLPSTRDITQLSQLLQSLDTNISPQEATILSEDIFSETQYLTEAFELTSPPLFHNTLVNIGIRKKGLCYHWSDTLYLYLVEQNLAEKKYSHFEFHLVGANIGEYFGEHNALVIIVKGGSIENGILIDPWRDSGKLYFSRVLEDKKYQWRHREERGCQNGK